MNCIKFKQCNSIYAKDQDDYLSLQVHKTDDGIVTSCWKMNWKERLKVLFSGKVYLQILTFNQQLQPQKMTVENPVK